MKCIPILQAFVLVSPCLSVTIEASTVQQFSLSSSNLPSPESIWSGTDDTSSFIFASFAGLLEQWPTTFAYSGHSIVPGVIPRSTLLYHGSNNGTPPPEQGMEWLAFDPEMSYKIHAGLSGHVQLLTYVTTRPLRVIYIDGQSASLASAAFLDSQNLLINGTVDKELGKNQWILGDYLRAEELCKIGKTYGFEGVVRMNTGFELIWCDFKRGIKLVQVVNTTDPFITSTKPKGKPSGPYGIPIYPNSPFYSKAQWYFAQAASRHYLTPGEVRVKLDPSGFVSFYDRVESLALKRRADGTDQGPRSRHRLYGISPRDTRKVLDRLMKVLIRKNAQGWQLDSDQVDWKAMVLTIIQTYSPSLQHLEYILKRQDLSSVNLAIQVRDLSYEMLMPYLDFSKWNVTDPTWANQAIKKCRTAFTSGKYEPSDLTESIQTIVRAIEGTLNRLCSTLLDFFSHSISMSLPISPLAKIDPTLEIETKPQILVWRNKTMELMKWLGWSTWGHCDPVCTPDEICLIPMWPAAIDRLMTNLTEIYPVCRNASYWSHPLKLEQIV